MKKPLENQTLFITRSADDFDAAVKLIEPLGGNAICCPMISIRTPQDCTALDESIRNIKQYDWVFFTSANGVKYFCQRMNELGVDTSTLRQTPCGIIGEKTINIAAANGIQSAFTPTKADAKTFMKEFAHQHKITGKRFLIPTSQIAHDIIPNQIKEHGGTANKVAAYETVHTHEFKPEAISLLQVDQPYWILFTSSSTVDAFVTCLKNLDYINATLMFASIGPSTTKTIHRHGYEPTVEATEYNMNGLINAITNHIKSNEK